MTSTYIIDVFFKLPTMVDLSLHEHLQHNRYQ